MLRGAVPLMEATGITSITASSSATPGLVAFNNPTVIVGLIGLAIAIFFIVKGIRGGVLLSILATTIIAIFAGVVIQFIFMNLDYARTENVQFEDDEYYYYVKAVPKKMIAKEEKVVKHFGNTGSLGKKIPRHNQENISKEAIAKDLEIDENIFEDDK